MNLEKWNSLPPNVQEAFEKASDRDFLINAGKVWQNDEKRGLELMEKFKKEHVVLTKEETEAFRVKLEPVVERWIEEVEKEGINGRKLVNRARKLIEKYDE
jgi:TRAP-type C4-dicarboxylate transport system substrate-binding protein